VIDALLIERKAEIANAGCTVETILDAAELCRRTALAIADGKVIGWFQGR
jgi:carbamoyltransferase